MQTEIVKILRKAGSEGVFEGRGGTLKLYVVKGVMISEGEI